MKKHEHKECKHELEYCKHCDIVFCKKCGKEWKYNFANLTFTTPSNITNLIPYNYVVTTDRSIVQCHSNH